MRTRCKQYIKPEAEQSQARDKMNIILCGITQSEKYVTVQNKKGFHRWMILVFVVQRKLNVTQLVRNGFTSDFISQTVTLTDRFGLFHKGLMEDMAVHVEHTQVWVARENITWLSVWFSQRGFQTVLCFTRSRARAAVLTERHVESKRNVLECREIELSLKLKRHSHSLNERISVSPTVYYLDL